MSDQTEDPATDAESADGAPSPEEPKVVASVAAPSATIQTTSSGSAPSEPTPVSWSPEPAQSPIDSIVAGFEGALTKLENALGTHKGALVSVLSNLGDDVLTGSSDHPTFTTSSALGQTLSSYVSRIHDIAADVEGITNKLEL